MAKKQVLIVVDMQNDFITGSLPAPDGPKIMPAVIARLEKAEQDGEAIIFTQDTHAADYLTTNEGQHLPVEHCIKPSWGWQICDELLPWAKKAAAIVEKPTFGSLELPALCRDYDKITLIGVCTGICVLSNAIILKAHYPEKEIAVEADATACINAATRQTALDALKLCQVEII